jgi:hypothetical protein
MTCNLIEIYQKSEKSTTCKFDPTRSDPTLTLTQSGPTRFLPENQTDLTHLIATSKKISIVKNIHQDQLIARLIIIKR